MGGTGRVCLIPDLDNELVGVLGQIEAMLRALARFEDDGGPGPGGLRAPLAGGLALDTLGRVQAAIVPTQTRTDPAGHEHPPAEPAAWGRLYGPDGRYEHRPLRVVVVDQQDLDVLAAAAAELGHVLATRPAGELADILQTGAAAASHPAPATAAELVEQLARAHGLLDLADDEDTVLLHLLLTDAAGSDIVLTPAQETAYQRLATRANAMWTSSHTVTRWLY